MAELTVATYLDDWMAVQRSQLAATTWDSYRQTIDSYLSPTVGETPLDELTTAQLSAAYARLLRAGGRRGKPLSARTVRYAHAVLHSALNHAVREGTIDTNPATSATLPRHRPGGGDPADDEPQIWDGDQIRRFLELTRDDPLHALWATALGTGMRRGELLGLRWVDVDLDEATIHVRRALVHAMGRLRMKHPKRDQRRSLRIDAYTAAVLEARRREQERDRREAGHAWADEWGLVFTDRTGAPLVPQAVTHAWRDLVATLPLPRMRLHDGRHSHASLLLAHGVPVPVVSARLGHSSAKMTLDRYAHVLPAMDEEAAATFEEQVFPDDDDEA